MTNGDEVMFPSYAANQYVKQGLTKREYFAALAMQGLLANPLYTNAEINGHWYEDVKIDARQQADNLIAALNQENKS